MMASSPGSHPSYRASPAWLGLALALVAACHEPREEQFPIEELDLGPPLGATFADPVLLTVAAARPRTRYLEDEGYTLTRGEDGLVYLATDTAGDLGLAFQVDGEWRLSEADYVEGVVIDHATSDGLVYRFSPAVDVTAEVRFVAATSRVAVADVVVRNDRAAAIRVVVAPWLLRCAGRFAQVAADPAGVRMRHAIDVDAELLLFAPGTYLEETADALLVQGASPRLAGLAACSSTTRPELEALLGSNALPGGQAAALVLPVTLELAAGEARALRLRRAVVAADREAQLDAELAEASTIGPAELLRQGEARLAAIPAAPAGLSLAEGLVYRSAFVLLDQLMMPAEGRLAHDYYLFSREPTWWFARLGQHVHESLAMLLQVRFDPAAALASHRVFIDRIEADGYLPYNLGPVVEQTTMGTASAPFFSYVAWELAQVTGDATFLTDAYRTGAGLHRFYVEQRDTDGDGLGEWGGYPITESVRDLENVIWANVAQPDEVEALCLNTLLAKDASVLGEMAGALGLADEAAAWFAASEERADRINAVMWDEETQFYYHVDRVTHTFDHAAPGDLKRMDLAGLLPLWAGIVPADRRAALVAHLSDPSTFYRDNGVAGLAATDPYYSPEASHCCRWNGPVWVPWQLLLVRALNDLGETDLARDLTRRTLGAVQAQLAQVHQFRELYDPDDATAPNHSMPNYVWTSLIALMMLEAQ